MKPRRRRNTESLGRRPCSDRGGQRGPAATRKGTARFACSRRKPEEAAKFLPQKLGREDGPAASRLRAPGLRNGDSIHFFCFSHPVFVMVALEN